MTRASLRRATSVLALLLTAAAPSGAHEIYKWVDENGVVHYGDARPENASSAVETLHIPEANPPDYDPAQAYRAIVEEAERIREQLAARRDAREDEEARERARAAEARLAELERRIAAAEETRYVTYVPFGLRKHPRLFPHVRHRIPDRRPPPRHPPDTGPRPGWPGPGE